MAQGLENYKFGSKNNWRRQVWNEARRRLKEMGTAPSSARVLYLPGPQNIDADIAISKGFRPFNLYAVEIDSERAIELRKKRVNVINADIVDVLGAWNGRDGLDFVFADFCGGYNIVAHRLAIVLLGAEGLSHKCVIAVNLQRGRDKFITGEALNQIFGDLDKHRGKRFYRMMGIMFIKKWIVSGADAIQAIRIWNKITKEIINPVQLTYKSISGIYFDSIIFNWGRMVNLAESDGKVYSGIRFRDADEDEIAKITGLRYKNDTHYVGGVQRRIAAAKAINTMRRNGGLGGL